MSNDHAELVSLLSVMSAAERGLSPLGPEFAGFVVLEAAQRLHEAGGGVVSARELAIDVAGQVHLVAQPARGDDVRCTTALRALLGALLETATSSTPALRACARRKELTSSALLVRELQAALIPLNRAASRRGVARVAKSTAEALASGTLPEPSFTPSPPAQMVAQATHAPQPSPEPAHLPSVIIADETTPCDAVGSWVGTVGATPVTLAEIERTIAGAQSSVVSTPVVDYSFDDDAPGDEEPFEVVSNLPPMVAMVAMVAMAPVATAGDGKASTLPGIGQLPRAARMDDENDSPHAAFAVPLASLTPAATQPAAPTASLTEPLSQGRGDRVGALLAGFSVSRLRSDPALSRDLKAMVGIETSMPPSVTQRTDVRADLRESASIMAVDVPSQPSEPTADDEASPYDDDALPQRRGGGRGLALFAFLVLGAGIAVGAIPRTRNAVRALFSPPSPPPGPATIAPAAPVASASVVHLPTACEAKLVVDGVPAGAEVVRKLGVAPISVNVPMHVPLDLVGVAPGMPPRLVHVDPSAAWLPDVTGPHLELPIMLDIGAASTWPARTGELATAPSEAPAGRGSLRIVGNPPGTAVWLVVTPSAITVPCGNPVELMVIVPPSAPRSLRVEWSSFTGSPPRSIAKL